MDRDDIGINIAFHEGISGPVSDSASGLREAEAVSQSGMHQSGSAAQTAIAKYLDLPAAGHAQRRRKRIRKIDVKSAIEAVAASGFGVSGVEFNAVNGSFTVLTGTPKSAQPSALAEWKQRRAR